MNRNLNKKQFFQWEDIEDRHPSYAEKNEGEDHYPMDNDLYRTVHDYMFSTSDDPDTLNYHDEEISFHPEKIKLADLSYNNLEGHPERGLANTDARVERAIRGKWGTGEGRMPPILVVRRAGVNHVADGNHRANAARIRGDSSVPAYVAETHIEEPLPKHGWWY